MFNIELYYPVYILQGDLYVARQNKNKVNLEKTGHVQYRKEYYYKGKRSSYQIDVVTESYMPKYLKVVNNELETIQKQLKRRKKLLRKSLGRLTVLAKKKSSKETYREIFGF